MEINVFRYNSASEANKRMMSDLLLSVWEDIDTSEIHSEEMDAVSFCAVENNRYIGYAGVVSWDISVQDETFKFPEWEIYLDSLFRCRRKGSV